MNIKECLEKRIPRVRQEIWVGNSYLRLPLMMFGTEPTHGPWAELYDDYVQGEVLGIRVGSQKIFVLDIPDTDQFVVYDGPISDHEKDIENFSHSYMDK
jgi:hypothetical protein